MNLTSSIVTSSAATFSSLLMELLESVRRFSLFHLFVSSLSDLLLKPTLGFRDNFPTLSLAETLSLGLFFLFSSLLFSSLLFSSLLFSSLLDLLDLLDLLFSSLPFSSRSS